MTSALQPLTVPPGPPKQPIQPARTPVREMLTWDDPRQPGTPQQALWRSENGNPRPKRVQWADDTLTADAAYRLVFDGTALLWGGDFQNARQLLQALARRIDRRPFKPGANLRETFHLQRQRLGQRSRLLGLLLMPLTADYRVPLRRAPDFQLACTEAYGLAPAITGAPALASGESAKQSVDDSPHSLVSLRELQALVGAHEWRKKGVEIPALGEGARIHPHWAVFSPVRGEYLDLVAQAPLPAALGDAALALSHAVDVGTGTGVIAALLARRGVARIVATELEPRALACAQDNLQRLGYAGQVTVEHADLFPAGRAPLIVCNPPWLPGQPTAPLEAAIYDPDSRMLRGFLAGLAAHLSPGGEGWLIMSDLAELIGLRPADALSGWISAAGLQVLGRLETRPRHGKAQDASDPLHAARSQEVTSLWRLAVME